MVITGRLKCFIDHIFTSLAYKGLILTGKYKCIYLHSLNMVCLISLILLLFHNFYSPCDFPVKQTEIMLKDLRVDIYLLPMCVCVCVCVYTTSSLSIHQLMDT